MYKYCFLLLSFLLFACQPSSSTSEEETGAMAKAVSAEPMGWQAIEAGGSTICSNGTPYSFFFRQGSGDKLLVFFQGGGACWNPLTCDLNARPTYDPVVDSTDNPKVGGEEYGWDGIFDFTEPENPFRDYSILVVPYCTGDTHLGNRDVDYPLGADSSLTIHHRGYTNAESALQWLYGQVNSPTTIVVTGASAGSIASPFYAALLAKQYPRARVVQMGDSSGAYRTARLGNLLSLWGVEDLFRAAGLSADSSYSDAEQLLITLAKKYPQVTFSQYNSSFDQVQRFFIAQLGDRPERIHRYLLENMQALETALPNYRYYVDTGYHHVILQRPEFYTTAGGGEPLNDWLTDLIEGRTVANRRCEPCQ